ncbi:MAG: alpha/beta hydrolase family protein [Pyrinomonadaceae bacterium]
MSKFLTVLVLLALPSVTGMAQWVVKLPQPTGAYQIGTTYFALADEMRPEAFTDDPKDHRELLVRCWYPAQPVPGAKPEPFWGNDTKEIGTLLAQFMPMPKTAFDDLALVQSHAYTDAPLSKSKSPYPVLVFSHGYIPGFLSQNTVQMEELASYGYVVFSIGHSYETVANIFSGGRVVPFSQARLMAFAQGAGKTRELNVKYAAATEPAEKEDLIKKIVAGWPLLEESLRIWAADVSFVLDEFERMNSGKRSSAFAKKLNLKRIGIFGMSFGGATAGQFCTVDKRCKAGINLDGLQSGDLIVRPMERPFMFMQSEDARNVNRLFFDRAENDAYYVVVKGTKHFNYSDFSLFSPDYQKAGILGTIDGGRMERIINDYVLAFFDKYLKGKDAPLLKGPPANYPEVEFNSHGRQAKRKK